VVGFTTGSRGEVPGKKEKPVTRDYNKIVVLLPAISVLQDLTFNKIKSAVKIHTTTSFRQA
jgi:hypothetical protein